MLSKRLNAILEMINDKETLIDVGCDHALLDIEALRKNKVKKALAIDINEKALNTASKNIIKYDSKDITLLNQDGLKDVIVNENDIVVISGLGTRTIKNIIGNRKISEIIIQSNNDIFELRTFMNKKYLIIDEKVVLDKGIYYVIIHFKLGNKKYSVNERLFGPIIVNSEKAYLKHLKDKYQKIYNDIPKKYFVKKYKYKLLIKLIDKNL
jgi:tRNA (adenine22-N1)-methyltransferase